MKAVKRKAVTVMAILLGATLAVITNAEWSIAEKSDTVVIKTVLKKSACKPSKRICFTEKKGDTVVVYKGRLRESTLIK